MVIRIFPQLGVEGSQAFEVQQECCGLLFRAIVVCTTLARLGGEFKVICIQMLKFGID
jgi:3-oxoacyl-[acyl-carrier-protein] synthase III